MVRVLDLDERSHVQFAPLHLEGHDPPQASKGGSMGGLKVRMLRPFLIFSEACAVAQGAGSISACCG
jgi:hypothetical protein